MFIWTASVGSTSLFSIEVYLLFWLIGGHLYIESSHSLCQNDTKLQTHPASILNVKMLNLPKIDAYNFKYKISVRNKTKLFFLLHKCINKQVHKLVHKWIDYTVSSAYITPIPFILLLLVNYK